MICLLLFGLIGILGVTYLYALYKFTYWKKLNVPYTPPTFPLGSCSGISRTRNLGDIIRIKYHEGRGSPFTGIFIVFGPGLLVRDPNLIKAILTKDFSSFSSRGFKINPDIDPLTGHLFFVDGAKWKNLRAKLSPTFTSGKMKGMFPIIEECCSEMEAYLKGIGIVEAGDLFTRYTTNVITRCAFGIDVDFFHYPDPMLKKMIHRVGNPTFLDAVQRGLSFSLGQFFKTLPFRLVPKELSDYFISLVEKTMAEREKSNIQRKDFIQSLLELKKKGYVEDVDAPKENKQKMTEHKFTAAEAAAQAFGFLLGGFDTSGSSMQCCIYELALNEEIQKRAREEVHTVLEKYDGKLTYESLAEMQYIEQIIQETLRLHPIAPFLGREVTQPYRVPDSDLILEPGVKIWISTAGLQSDPTYFPQPEVFDPDRFSPENRDKIQAYTFMPFGDGPRICIGNRFAMMQMKSGIAWLLNKFKIERCEKTPVPPLKMDPKKALGSVVGGTHVKITSLEAI